MDKSHVLLWHLLTGFTSYLIKSSKILDKCYFIIFMSNTNQLCRSLFAKGLRVRLVREFWREGKGRRDF